jgi:hypothetical protein
MPPTVPLVCTKAAEAPSMSAVADTHVEPKAAMPADEW